MSTSIRLSCLSRRPSSTPWLSLSQGEEGKERRREREREMNNYYIIVLLIQSSYPVFDNI